MCSLFQGKFCNGTSIIVEFLRQILRHRKSVRLTISLILLREKNFKLPVFCIRKKKLCLKQSHLKFGGRKFMKIRKSDVADSPPEFKQGH